MNTILSLTMLILSSYTATITHLSGDVDSKIVMRTKDGIRITIEKEFSLTATNSIGSMVITNFNLPYIRITTNEPYYYFFPNGMSPEALQAK